MTNSKMKLSPPVFFLIGMFVSVLLGGAESQLLLNKSLQYRETMLWKYTILFYCLTMAYVFWYYETKPDLRNIYLWVLRNLFLSLPYFIMLVLTKTFSIISILTVIPAQIFFLATTFVYHVIGENNPDLKTTKLLITGFIIGIGVASITASLDMPQVICLFFACVSVFIYFMLALYFITKNRKKELESSEPMDNKNSEF